MNTARGRVWLVAYGIVAALNLVAQVGGWTPVGRVTVWLVAPLLAGWTLTTAPRPLPRPLRLLLVGLVFAFGGDVLLSLPGDALFPLGMVSFLGMQVLYVLAFRAVPGPGLLRAWPVAWAPFALAWVILLALVWGGAGQLLVPLMVYGAALLVMAAQAFDLVLRVPRPLGWRVAWGAALFVVSDALIALSRFGPVPRGTGTSVAIMATYLAAQAMIVTGFVAAVAAVLSRRDRDAAPSATPRSP